MPSPARVALPWLLVLLALLAPVAARAQDPLADALLLRVNEARAEGGLASLVADPGLTRAAQGHAEELARRGTLSHESLDPDRRTPSARVARAGVALVEVAENLAAIEGPDVVERVVAGWLDSPGHRRNLLNDAYTHVGHAVAVDDRGVHRVVQVLAARPLVRTEASARLAHGAEDAVTVEIRYDDPDAPLALFVEGVHEPSATVAPGVLRTTRPLPEAPLRVSVGIDRGDGSARRVERFVLLPGPPPALLPGAPEQGDAGGGT